MGKWMIKRSKADIKKMSEAMGISVLCACALANRGLHTSDDIKEFLSCDMESLSPPESINDMEKGADIIKTAIKNRDKIAVYGDYDADGVTSTVILYKTIKRLGGQVIYYVPHRQREGYGLNTDAVEELAKMETKILLTCDNGISAAEEIRSAKAFGMKVVVIDHHEPEFIEENGVREDMLPSADAVIDPKKKSCASKFKSLCAGGLAYKFAECLCKSMNVPFDEKKELLAFAAIATVCDMVDLLSENRTIVKNGLINIKSTGNAGLDALISAVKLDGKRITEYHIGFIIGPCINATGRLESAEMALELFLEQDRARAEELACGLVAINASRKNMSHETTEKVISIIEKEKMENDSVIVVYCPDAHESVAGIVAGRIKEKYSRPAIVITRSNDMAKGSGRSIEGYNMFDELFNCKELFVKFGGHAMAAGLTLPHENISVLRERLNKNYELDEELRIPVLRIESEARLKDVSFRLAEELSALAPFGRGNEIPLFGTKCVSVRRLNLIGPNKDIIKFQFDDQTTGRTIDGISFDGYEKFKNLLSASCGKDKCSSVFSGGRVSLTMDIVYSVDIKEYNGSKSLQLVVKDFRDIKEK